MRAAWAVAALARGPAWEVDLSDAATAVAPLVALLLAPTRVTRTAAANALNGICYEAPGEESRISAVSAGVFEAAMTVLKQKRAPAPDECSAVVHLLHDLVTYPAHRAGAIGAGATGAIVALLLRSAAASPPPQGVLRLAMYALGHLAEAAPAEVGAALTARGGAGAAALREYAAAGARGAGSIGAISEAALMQAGAAEILRICALGGSKG